MRIHSKLTIFIVALIIVTVSIFTVLLMQTHIQSLRDGVDQKLMTAARMIKVMQPHDFHDRISDESSLSDEEYRDIVDRYNQLCRKLGLQYLWSVLDTEDGLRFTSATSPDHDVTRGKHAGFFDIHSSPEVYASTLVTMQPTYTEFNDEWGHGRMLLLPYLDGKGRKFLFGASMNIDYIDKIISDTVMRSLWVGGLVLLFALAAMYFISRTLSKPLTDMVTFAEQIAAGGSREDLDIRGGAELETLSIAFNAMSRAVTDREVALKLERRRTFAFMDNAPAMIYVKDHKGRYLMANNEMAEFYGIPCESIIRRTDADFLPAEISEKVHDNDMAVLSTGQPMEYEETVVLNGEKYIIFSTKFLIRDEEHEQDWVCGISVDITSRKEAEGHLKLARKALETVTEGILITDANGVIIEVNPAFTEITGFDRSEAIGQKPNIGKSGRHDDSFYREMWGELTRKGRWTGEVWDKRANGEEYPKSLSIACMRDGKGGITNYVGIFQDITKQKATEESLNQLAFYDPLTGLPNRVYFQERLAQEIDTISRADGKLGVLFIDIDRFKHVNDSLGHSVGDQLLKEVAGRLKHLVRDTDTVARLGGDEFSIIHLAVENASEVERLAQSILDTMSIPFRFNGRDIFLDSSIGIVMYPDDAFVTKQLLRCADLAMYRAKEAGRGQYAFFKSEMTSASAHRLSLETDLRQAIANGEFEAYYQPKIESQSNKVAGMEALIRWNHPQKGLILPDQFIPLAEETGLIIPIGRWVLECACRQTRLWHDMGMDCLRVAVNLSARQFADPTLVDAVAEILANTGLPGSGLELEITESVIMKNVERAVDTFQQFSDMGVRISVDDFGTGYSSLAYLKKFPIHTLKIDRSFVMDLETDKDDQAIVQSIGSLAQNLNLCVVAEGVENEFQLSFLKGMYCQYIQGYYFSRPLPTADFETFSLKCGTQDSAVCDGPF